jgi:hypothetical protein
VTPELALALYAATLALSALVWLARRLGWAVRL